MKLSSPLSPNPLNHSFPATLETLMKFLRAQKAWENILRILVFIAAGRKRVNGLLPGRPARWSVIVTGLLQDTSNGPIPHWQSHLLTLLTHSLGHPQARLCRVAVRTLVFLLVHLFSLKLI